MSRRSSFDSTSSAVPGVASSARRDSAPELGRRPSGDPKPASVERRPSGPSDVLERRPSTENASSKKSPLDRRPSGPENNIPSYAPVVDASAKRKASLTGLKVSNMIVVCLEKNRDCKENKNAYFFVEQDHLGICGPDITLVLLSVANTPDDAEGCGRTLRDFEILAEMPHNSKRWSEVYTKVIPNDGRGIGHTIKAWANQMQPRLLVLGCHKDKSTSMLKRWTLGSVSDFVQQHAQCPVLIVKTDHGPTEKIEKKRKEGEPEAPPKSLHVAIACEYNDHSRHAVDWLLQNGNLATNSTMVIVHAVKKPSEKEEARKFLASFTDACLDSKKKWTMKSGLVYFKDKTAPESILKYCNDYHAHLVVMAPRGLRTMQRLTSKHVTDHVVHGASCDVLVFKDERTRQIEGITRRPSLVSSQPSVPAEEVPAQEQPEIEDEETAAIQELRREDKQGFMQLGDEDDESAPVRVESSS